MYRLVDTHCHLDFEAYNGDLDEVIQNAVHHGVVSMIIPGINLESSRKAVQIAEKYGHIYAAIGVHPNESRTWNETTLGELKAMASHKKIVAIGEIGLDYYRERAPRELQINALRKQLELAALLELPVIIHNRRATQDILPILDEWYEYLGVRNSPLTERPGVLHSYSEQPEVAQSATDKQFFIGISGPITYPKADSIQNSVRSIPKSKILIETDAPYLPPQAYRGQRNEPANVRLIAEKLAQILDLTIEMISNISTSNASYLFNLREID